MPINLASYFGSGVEAGMATEKEGIQVDQARVQLQDMVDPQLRDAKKQATLAESSVKQLQARVLQDTVKYNEDSAKALQGIMSNPANKDKPASELYKLAIDAVVDPKIKLGMMKELPKMQQEEEAAMKSKEQVDTMQRNKARQIAESINPNDEASIQKALMEAHVNGMYSDQYIKDANDPSNGKTPQERHQKAKDNLLSRLKTIEEKKIEETQRRDDRHADQEHERIMATLKSQELAARRQESLESHRDFQEKAEKTKLRLKTQDEYGKAQTTLRNNFDKAWQAAIKEADPAKSIEMKKFANDEYNSGREELDDKYRPQYEELNIPLRSFTPPQAAAKPEAKTDAAPDAGDIELLKSSPTAEFKAKFDSHYGAGAADKALGGETKPQETKPNTTGPGKVTMVPRVGQRYVINHRGGKTETLTLEEARKRRYIE